MEEFFWRPFQRISRPRFPHAQTPTHSPQPSDYRHRVLPPNPPPPRISRRRVLQLAGSLLAGGAGVAMLSQTQPVRAAFSAIAEAFPAKSTPAPVTDPARSLGYFHGCFEVNTPAEVDTVAALGVNYTITYGDWSWASADPTAPLGRALARNGMKTFLNIEYPFLQCDNTGQGYLTNAETVRNLVRTFRDSPLLAGYWIKDDNCSQAQFGELNVLRELNHIIREIDPDPNHLIMPGFGEAYSVALNYQPGIADLLGFYPYPGWSRGPAQEVPDMLRIVRDRTPAGQTPPPFIGIYQAFATPPVRPILSVGSVVGDVAIYMAAGAVGVAAFGWDQAPPETFVAGNNDTLRAAIPAVTNWLKAHP